jgi:hypothetical protein
VRKYLLVVPGVALGAVLGLGGYAIGASKAPAVDTACVTSKHVLSHIYARSTSCPKGQTKLVWNQKGPAGSVALPFAVPSAVATLGNGLDSVTDKCPPAAPHAIGGGYAIGPTSDNESTTVYTVTYDGPAAVGPESGYNAWTVTLQLPDPSATTETSLTVSVICEQ